MKANRELDAVVVIADSPEDRRHGGNLRIWWLLGGGCALVVCARRRSRGAHGLPLSDRLPWFEIAELAPSARGGFPGWEWARVLLQAASRMAETGTPIFASGPLQLVEFAARHAHGPVVADLYDSAALYHWRRAKDLRSRDPLRAVANLLHALQSLRREVAIARRADLTIVSSPVDAAFLQRFVPNHRIRVVGNGTDWLGREPPEEDSCQRARLVFHGGFSWYPNSAALEHLVRAHWPKIRAQVPGVEFHVAGHSMSAPLRELCERHGIVVRGYVEDVFEVVATCGLYVAPMVAGGGVKNKIMEAMAAGVPVVTNTMGAEALPPEARQVVAIRDDPQEFADYVRDVMADPARWSELRRQTRLAAEHCFDWRHRRAEFMSLLTAAVAASGAGVHAAT